jgi:hypothetical protein
MGVIALSVVLLLFLLYGLPLVVLFFGILIAARCGYPRSSGRRKYLWASLFIGLTTIGLHLYLRTDRETSGLAALLPWASMVVFPTAAFACLLATICYRPKS